VHYILQVSENELHQGGPSLTSVPRDSEVNSDKVKVECNGAILSHENCYSDCLRRTVDTLNAELTQCRQLIANLQQTERNLRQRLITLLPLSVFVLIIGLYLNKRLL